MEFQRQTTIDLTRTTPPMPAWVGPALRQTLTELGDHDDLELLLRNHRFSGYASDREAGSHWLQRRFGRLLEPGQITVTNGTQNALFILFSQIIPRGGLLFTEEFTYHGLHAHARLASMQQEIWPGGCQL